MTIIRSNGKEEPYTEDMIVTMLTEFAGISDLNLTGDKFNQIVKECTDYVACRLNVLNKQIVTEMELQDIISRRLSQHDYDLGKDWIIFNIASAIYNDNQKDKPESPKKVLLLSSPTCPRCKILKEKLDAAGIAYAVEDDPETVETLMKAIDVEVLPVLQVNDILLDFKQGCDWVKAQADKKTTKE